MRLQLGILYHHYISQAERGVFIGDKKLAAITKQLKTHFENVKDLTKARLEEIKKLVENKKSKKSRKPRDSQKNRVDRRKMLNRKYLRS